MKTESFHIPVLLHESIVSLALTSTDIVVDGTFGGGGHSKAILDHINEQGKLICVDLDEAAHERFVQRFGQEHRAFFVQSNFKDAQHIVESAHVTSVNKVLLDLGTSTFQLLADTKGFSFNSDAPLHMAFSHTGSHTGFNASDIVNTWREESIADIIYGYGEDRSARKIAAAIVAARAEAPITTSKMLADIIERVIRRRGRIHPATKTFQALRITVNDELRVITEALDAWKKFLAPGGRISVITFHSLEDRVVKQWMKSQEQSRVITKKPIIPSTQELQTNPRSRSAKLRTIEF